MSDITVIELQAAKAEVEAQISEILTEFAKEQQVHVSDIEYDITNYRGIKAPPWSDVRVRVEIKI